MAVGLAMRMKADQITRQDQLNFDMKMSAPG